MKMQIGSQESLQKNVLIHVFSSSGHLGPTTTRGTWQDGSFSVNTGDGPCVQSFAKEADASVVIQDKLPTVTALDRQWQRPRIQYARLHVLLGHCGAEVDICFVLAHWRLPSALVKSASPEVDQVLWLADVMLSCQLLLAPSQVAKVAVDLSLHVALQPEVCIDVLSVFGRPGVIARAQKPVRSVVRAAVRPEGKR